jgi:glycogen(starch) synthase
MMKVLMISSGYPPAIGGVQQAVYNLAKALQSRNVRVSVLAGGTKISVDTRRIDGVRVTKVPFHVFRGTPKSLFAFLIRGPVCLFTAALHLLWVRPDIVNVHFLGANAFYTMILRKLFRFKLVVTLHGTIEAPSTQLHETYGRCEANIMNWTARHILFDADAVVAVSTSILSKVLHMYPELKSKCLLIPEGVEDEMWQGEVAPHDGSYILAIGRLSREKGFDVLLRAFAVILENCRTARLLLVGDGPESLPLKGLAERLRIDNNVTFYGSANRAEVRQLIAACQMMIVPSRIEGFGIVVLEGMALGKTVVASNTGGIPDIISDKVSGLLVPPEDELALAQAIVRVMSDNALRERIGSSGRTSARRFTWGAISQTYLSLYDTVHAT